MKNTEARLWALGLSFPLALLLAGTSFAGALSPFIYTAETRIRAAQVVGNDVGNLVVVAPVLTIAAVLGFRGSLAARLVWMGTLVYLVYDFLGYAFDLHFNRMFLAYCGILGLSFYALVGSISPLSVEEVAQRHGPHAPVNWTAIVLLLMTAGSVFHWLAEVVPALLASQTPQAIRDSGHFTEPVAVLDLALLLPACLITAILLLRRKPLGLVLGPVLLTFLALSSLVLIPMGRSMEEQGFKAGFVFYAVAVGVAVCSAVLLTLWFREGWAGTPQR